MTTYAKLMDDPIGITKRKKNPKIRIGTWNVRGTYSEGKHKQLVQKLQRYNIEVAAIQETKQKGKFITETDNYILFNSGIDNRELGTGFMVKKSLKGAVITFKPISERMSYIRLRSKYRKISLLNIHAPTEEKDLEVKTEYYKELEREYVKIPKHDIKMVIGDANAMIGKENCYSRERKQTPKNESKWRKTDRKGDAQLITRLRSYRGAEANSGHFLVRADLKQEIPKKKEGKKTQRDINVNKLKKAEVQQEYEQKMNERIRSIEQDIPIEERWEELQENIWKTSEEVLGFVKKDNKNRNEWFDEECRKAIEAGRNFYQNVKKEKRGYQPRVIYCKDKDDNLIGDEQARIKRWAEYFEELLNEQDTQQDTNERVNDSDDPDETIEIDEGEIRETLRQMKNNKSPGRNGIKGEMLKYGGEAVASEIHRLVLECWKEGKMPEQWSEAVLCPIFKKGDITKCENYR
ncbi:craniofacial development protein 2-like [Zophobas morio]|uniref:craniofacial development protein 2-like n=1 Tax=Zophobas morio TaxID=2755281 RepID=UPI0030832FDC